MAVKRVVEYRGGKRQVRDYLSRQWHRRTIMVVGGSLHITLPAQLVEWDRKIQMEPTKWQPGDEVEIALLSNGRFLVRWSEGNRQRGTVPEDEVENVDHYDPPPKKRKYKVTKHLKHGGKKVVFVDEDDVR